MLLLDDNTGRIIEEARDIREGEYIVYQDIMLPTIQYLGDKPSFLPLGNARYIKGESYGHSSWSDPRFYKESFEALFTIRRSACS